MPYQMQLLNKGHALLVRTGESVTMNEFAEINEKILTYSRAAAGTLHLITDMMQTREHPRDAIEFQWASEPNIGWVIYLSNNQHLNTMVDTAMNQHGQNYLVLNDMKAAMAIIAMESGMAM